MSKATEAVLEPLVSEGLALIAQIKAKEAELDAKRATLDPISEDLKELDAQLEQVKAKLIEKGGGRYCNEVDHTITVVPAIPPVKQPDRFVLPDGALDIARELAGEHFKKLFDRDEIFTPKPGLELGVDLLMTPKKGRELIALCLVPGELKGGRSASIRWNLPK